MRSHAARRVWVLIKIMLLLGRCSIQVTAKLIPRSMQAQENNPNLIELDPKYRAPEKINEGDYFKRQQQKQSNFFDTATISSKSQSVARQISRHVRRLHQQSPSISATLFSSIAVFVAWQIPKAQPFLERHFMRSGSGIQDRRYHTLLLASISHSELYYLLINCMALLSFGPSVQRAIAPRPVWPFLLGASLSGSVMSLTVDYLLKRFERRGLGLLGVTLALMAFWSRMNPEGTVRFFLGPIPISTSAKMALYALFSWSVLASLFPVLGGSVGHSAHLGGLLFGCLYYEWWASSQRK